MRSALSTCNALQIGLERRYLGILTSGDQVPVLSHHGSTPHIQWIKYIYMPVFTLWVHVRKIINLYVLTFLSSEPAMGGAKGI